MVAVDGKDGEADVYVLVLEVRSVFIAIHGDIEVYSLVAEDVLLQHVEAFEEALLAGVDLVE